MYHGLIFGFSVRSWCCKASGYTAAASILIFQLQIPSPGALDIPLYYSPAYLPSFCQCYHMSPWHKEMLTMSSSVPYPVASLTEEVWWICSAVYSYAMILALLLPWYTVPSWSIKGRTRTSAMYAKLGKNYPYLKFLFRNSAALLSLLL